MENVILNDDTTNLSLYIEKLKEDNGFETFIETIVYYHDNETDMEMSQISKNLNQRIRDKIAAEANQLNLLKHKSNTICIDL